MQPVTSPHACAEVGLGSDSNRQSPGQNFQQYGNLATFKLTFRSAPVFRGYEEMETQGMEGAACDLASVSSLSDVDTSFHGQHVSVHTDSSDASIDRAGR